MDLVQTLATPTTSADWDYFILQMDKIAILLNRVNFTDNRIDATQDEIIEIKEFITGEELGELDLKNVIDNKKLPGTLTINLKKRYEQIGKQFVAGAGRLFERIKNAIETKLKMKTDENSIRKEIDKAKLSSKKMSKGNGFWKKLLAVLAILSMVTFIFKDKLIKMLPDMSNGIEGVGDSVYNFLKNTITGMVLYSQKLIGGTMSSVINYICKEILPGTIGTFFNDTLPTALVVATLSVMSMLSDSAGKQLEDYLGTQSDARGLEMATKMLQAATSDLAARNEAAAKSAVTLANIEGWDRSQIEDNIAMFGNTLWDLALAKGGLSFAKSIYNLLDLAADANGDVDLRENLYNITPLLQRIWEIQNDKQLSETAKNNSINKAIEQSLQSVGVNTSGMNFAGLHLGLINAALTMMNDTRYVKLNLRFRTLNAAQGGLPSGNTELIKPETPAFISVKKVEIEDVMMNLIASQTKSILVSLDKFLNKEGDETLFKGITTYMENLNLETNKYFSNVFDILTKSLVRGLYIQLPTEKGNDSTQNSSFSFTIGNDSNVSIINVNILDTFTTQFSAIKEVHDSQTSVIKIVLQTNEILTKINENLGYGLFILHIDDERLKTQVSKVADDLHKGIRKNAEGIKQVNERITKLHSPKDTPTHSSGTPNGATPPGGS